MFERLRGLRAGPARSRPQRPSGSYSLELMRDDVLAFLAALGPEPVDLVGHSTGGVVAYLVAAERPERVRRLVLEDVPAPFPRKPGELVRPAGPLPYGLRRWSRRWKGQLDEPDPAWPAALGRITAPTLVVAGGSRSHVAAGRHRRAGRIVPDCGSSPSRSDTWGRPAGPEEFAVVVTDLSRPRETGGSVRTAGRGCCRPVAPVPDRARGPAPVVRPNGSPGSAIRVLRARLPCAGGLGRAVRSAAPYARPGGRPPPTGGDRRPRP